MWCDHCAATLTIHLTSDFSLVFAIIQLSDSAVIDSFSWRLVWLCAVLVMIKMLCARGVSVFNLGAPVCLAYPLGSVAVLIRCSIVSDR